MQIKISPAYYPDFGLVARGDVVIHCHRAVMGSASSVIRTFLASPIGKGLKKCVYDLSERSSEAVQNVVNYVYTGTLEFPETIVETLELFNFLDITVNEKQMFYELPECEILKICRTPSLHTMSLLKNLVENVKYRNDVVMVYMLFDPDIVYEYMWKRVHSSKDHTEYNYKIMLFAIYAMLYLQDRMPPRMSIEKLVTIMSVIIVRVPSLESKIPPHDSITKYIRTGVYRFLPEKSPEKLKEFENDVNDIYNIINGISDDEKK